MTQVSIEASETMQVSGYVLGVQLGDVPKAGFVLVGLDQLVDFGVGLQADVHTHTSHARPKAFTW